MTISFYYKEFPIPVFSIDAWETDELVEIRPSVRIVEYSCTLLEHDDPEWYKMVMKVADTIMGIQYSVWKLQELEGFHLADYRAVTKAIKSILAEKHEISKIGFTMTID